LREDLPNVNSTSNAANTEDRRGDVTAITSFVDLVERNKHPFCIGERVTAITKLCDSCHSWHISDGAKLMTLDW
jgi:hypothetical protein